MELVINTCFGGFSLSRAAHSRLGSVYVEAQEDPFITVGYWDTSSWDQGLDNYTVEYRSLPALVDAVKLLCAKAAGSHARLKVVEVPDDAKVYISEYDGREVVREVHRAWG